MRKITVVDRIILLITGLLAGYQVAFGVEGHNLLIVLAYTIAFGALLVAGLILLILGFEVLGSPATILVSTLIPLSLSLGLVAEFFPDFTTAYLIFAIAGFLAIVITRFAVTGKIATIVLATVHGIAGLIIFGLPIFLVLSEKVPAGFVWVGVGGALIGIGGLLLSFLKLGNPILNQDTILKVLPGLLFLMTAAFVAGFSFA